MEKEMNGQHNSIVPPVFNTVVECVLSCSCVLCMYVCVDGLLFSRISSFKARERERELNRHTHTQFIHIHTKEKRHIHTYNHKYITNEDTHVTLVLLYFSLFVSHIPQSPPCVLPLSCTLTAYK